MPPPRIIVHPMDITRPVTENATFVCVGQGYGFVDVRWFSGGRSSRRSPPSKSIVTTMVTQDSITSTLTIPDLIDYDGGRYRCRYSNNGGETNSNQARLTIGSRC